MFFILVFKYLYYINLYIKMLLRIIFLCCIVIYIVVFCLIKAKNTTMCFEYNIGEYGGVLL